MNCIEFKKIINEYIDGELQEDIMTEASEHMKNCKKCSDMVLVYKKLSESIKSIDDEKIPDDFKVEFPKKKNVVYLFFRKYEKVAASLVAAVALIIFANGIDKEYYKPPVSEEYKVVSEKVTDAEIKPLTEEKETPLAEEKDIQKSEETKKSAAAPQKEKTVSKPQSNNTPSEQADNKNVSSEKTTDSEDEIKTEAVENAPETVSENPQADKKENEENIPIPASMPVAMEIPENITETEVYSEEPETAEESEIPQEAPATFQRVQDDSSEGCIEEILSYSIPAEEEFINEEDYKIYSGRLENIKNRARECSENEIASLYDEFTILVNEITTNLK